MRLNGLIITYENGIDTVQGRANLKFPVGELLCRIYQGETLYNISRIVRNHIGFYPMNEDELTQDGIEEAERFILESFLYDDFFPAQRLAQGCFIRFMEMYRALDNITAKKLLADTKENAALYDELFSDFGFDTVGAFLRLCFNNYLIDLINGIDLFKAMAAVWSGTATDD